MSHIMGYKTDVDEVHLFCEWFNAYPTAISCQSIKEDEDERWSSAGYESEDNSGEDREDQEPAPPSKRKRLSRVYFIED